MRHTTSLRI
jgi:hypothetical protein